MSNKNQNPQDKIKQLEDENQALKIQIEFLKQLVSTDTNGDPVLELCRKYQKELAEIKVLKMEYRALITKAALERQSYQIEVENLLKQLRGSVQRKHKFEKERETMQFSGKT